MNTDAERLSYLMADIDGFYGVAKDRYDFATDVAVEKGKEEPTVDDELEGFRRLIDAAISISR